MSWRRVNFNKASRHTYERHALARKHDRIINAHLKNGDIDISATDWMASPAFNPIQGNTFAIFIVGKTYDELKAVFDKLAEGADKNWFQELHDLSFGVYGQFFDKYGVQWIFKGDKKNRSWLHLEDSGGLNEVNR